jgi:Uma2 family endonuclease
MEDTMVGLSDLANRLAIDDPEERQILGPVPWSQYEVLLADLGDASPYRVHFLEGVLEIVAPSRRHESGKTRIGTLLEIYFLETDTEYFPMGSTTLRNLNRQAGGEPDESYCIGSDKAIPDLAIEIIVTSGGINRLELYRRLAVREVWFWQDNTLTIYRLRKISRPNLWRQQAMNGLLTVSYYRSSISVYWLTVFRTRIHWPHPKLFETGF